jgi:hypothetical protein
MWRSAGPMSSDRHILGAGVRDDYGTGVRPSGAHRARAAPGWSDTARGTGERPRVGRAGLHRHRPAKRKGWRTGPGSAQLPVAGAAALVCDQPASSATDLVDRRHDLYGLAPLRALAQNWLLLFTACLPALAIMIVLNNVAGEIGWTGFVFARFQDRHGPLRAALSAHCGGRAGGHGRTRLCPID